MHIRIDRLLSNLVGCSEERPHVDVEAQVSEC